MEKNHQKNVTKIIILLLLINISFTLVTAFQCNNGIDDNGDGLIDALVELDPNNGESHAVATNNPWEILAVTKTQSGESLSSCAGGMLRHRIAGWGDLANNQIDPTAEKICNLVGYANVKDTECRHTGSDNRCNFHSPKDNCMWYWDGTKFSSENAHSKYYKSWLSTLICEDRLAACNNGIDDNGNGLIDMDDPGCASINDDSETQHDPDCESPTDDDESTPECVQTSDCSNQNHNSENMCDKNTLYYNSYTYGCSSDGNCEEDITRVDVTNCDYGCTNGVCETTGECQDGIDNDDDGNIDELDSGCWDNTQNPDTYNPDLDNEGRSDSLCNEDCDCGVNVPVGTVCQENNVYLEVLKSICKLAGTGSSFCSTTTIFNFTENCDYGCSGGSCYGNCNTQTDCGTDSYSAPYCGTNNNSYRTFHDFDCDNHNCNEATSEQLFQTCDFGCYNGECQGQLPGCSDGIDNDGDGYTDLDDAGCNNADDDNEIDCFFNYQCGTDTFILGTETCSNNDVWADHTYYTCENAAQNNAQCTLNIFSRVKQYCGASSCEDLSIPYCIDNTVYYDQNCQNKGCSSNSCTSETVQNTIEVTTCEFGCTAGTCNNFVDENGPEITLLSPDNSSTQYDIIQFNYTTTDESAVKSCSLTINDVIQQSSNNISQEANTFTQSLNETNKHYTWFIDCLDIYNNYEESDHRSFLYTDSYCEQTSDCEEASEDLICEGDDVVKEIITPLCQANNTCYQDITYEFVKECNDGCLNGHCKSDRKKKIDDDVLPIINTDPLIELFDNSRSKLLLENTTALGVKTSKNINWIFILLFLLFAGIILLLLLISYILLK